MSQTVHVASAPVLGVYPGVLPRLLAAVGQQESLDTYRAQGGYGEVTDVDHLFTQVTESGLRGRGGAAFPTAIKIRTVREGPAVPVVVANGEEGEPTSVKDRWLLRHRPHLVLDGLRLAALLVGTEDVHVYVSDPASADSIRHALADLAADEAWTLDVRVTCVDAAYVAGEESAAVRAINGGPALPTDKPPRPFEVGVDGRPTLISNVETLANLPLIHAGGAAGFRELGTAGCPGTFLMTLGGAVQARGLCEVPFGVTMRDVLNWLGEDLSQATGFLVGGYFAGVFGPELLDVPLDYDAFKGAGTGLGCGAMVVLDPATCPVAVSHAVMAYFARENAGQCGSCFNGTAAMSAVLSALRDQRAESSDVERLLGWSTNLRGRGACGTLDGATNIAASLLARFPLSVQAHLGGRCTACTGPDLIGDPAFAMSLPDVVRGQHIQLEQEDDR